jgi:CRISPR-associated endonuclease/helicase Cas3
MFGESPREFWAKTTDDGRPGISVRDHCLNVGTVAEALIALLPECVRGLLPPGAATLAALHDVGKISPGFQLKCEWWRERYETPELAAGWGQGERKHAAVSHAILGSWLDKNKAGYAIAAGGHHGFFVHNELLPPIGERGRPLAAELSDPAFAIHRKALRELLAEVFAVDLPSELLSAKDEALIVFLTGFMTMADWLGSNEDFFPLSAANFAAPLPIADAIEAGRAGAAKVMNWLRWGSTAVAAPLEFHQLFPFSPNEIQRALPDLAAHPGLFIVEAPMGSGKTEAALVAAYRRWTAAEGERGIYFALPTQLTSERIFDRLESFLAKSLASPDLATLVHGSAWLREKRVLEIHPASLTGDGEQPAEYARDARLWFASSRQALLAPFGAGTIDQALLGALPAKHCGLRLFGLAGKVVVLDEVHSYDRYTGTLVERLVADLMRLNATVIVLSATLTAERKRTLLASAGVSETALPEMSPDDPYPMITFATRDETWRTDVKPVEWKETPRAVSLDHRDADDGNVWVEACDAARDGACVLIIRNTVALAQETWRTLRNEVCEGGPPVALLHSRFPRWRRDALEDHWIAALGTKGPRPSGCLLVATQVVEQSVDIDADFLITDLAPTDLLFQRLGRLQRHSPRRPARFTEPSALVLHPRMAEDMDERALRAAFGTSGFVYPPYVLWRSARHWRGRHSVTIPCDIRRWIEATYQPVDHEQKSAAAVLCEDWKAKNQKHATVADRRSKRLRAHNQPDEEGVFTRWNNQPTADLLLCREKPERIAGTHSWSLRLLDGEDATVPYEWSFAAASAIHRNVVRVPAYAVRGWFGPEHRWLHDYLDVPALGIVVGDTILPASETAQPYLLRWNANEGVRIDKATAPPLPSEPEDGWW